MRVFDLVTPDGGGPVRQVGRFTASQPAIIHNVHTRGDLVFASYYTARMRVIDVSTPRLPVEVGFIDTFQGASQTFEGAWGVYPYDPAGRIFISDQQTGLWIVRFDGRIAVAPTGIEVRAAPEEKVSFPGGPLETDDGAAGWLLGAGIERLLGRGWGVLADVRFSRLSISSGLEGIEDTELGGFGLLGGVFVSF